MTDLVYHICELRKVFSRLREFIVAVNPKKTKLGLEEFEYVGHVVSSMMEKRLKVLNFPRPQAQKALLNSLAWPITSAVMCRT